MTTITEIKNQAIAEIESIRPAFNAPVPDMALIFSGLDRLNTIYAISREALLALGGDQAETEAAIAAIGALVKEIDSKFPAERSEEVPPPLNTL